MTQETLTRPDLGDLSVYTRDGLELFISDSGEVYASQSAIARMLGMQQGHLSSVLKNPILPTSKGKEVGYTVKLPSPRGVREQTLYGVSTIAALASRYNPAVSVKFAEMGAKVYLYKLAGYEVNVERDDVSSTSVSGNDTYMDYLKTAHEAIGKLMNIRSFAQDLPGLQAYIELAESEKGKTLGGRMTIDAMAEYFGYELSSDLARQIGRSMAGVARSQEGDSVSVVRKRYQDKKGNYQSYDVAEYTTKYLPLFNSLCLAYGLVPTKT